MSEHGGGTLDEMDRKECFALLATQPVGRLAVAGPDEAPIVVPVNFVLDGEVIVFRSDVGTKVRLLRQGPVAFEAASLSQAMAGW